MKKLLLILLIFYSSYSSATIHQILVWNGYMQFLPSSNLTVQLGDTIEWVPLDPPTMYHTITSSNIPNGAISFDQPWQLPVDTFFQYIPQVTGIYQYVCTPHIPMGMVGEFTVTNSTCQATSIDSIDNNIACVGDTLTIYGNNLCVPMSVNLQGWTIPDSLVLLSTSNQVSWILPPTSFTISGVNLRYIDSLNASTYTNIISLEVGSHGCTDITASNYDSLANCDDGSCIYSNCSVAINSGDTEQYICYGDTINDYLDIYGIFDTIIWTSDSSNSVLGNSLILDDITIAGTYFVSVTDSNNCVAVDSIEVIIVPQQPLNPFTIPTFPVVCIGDSVVIEVDQGFLNYWWNTGNPLDQDENRVVVYPIQDFTYIVEAEFDFTGCKSRAEIEVFVDTCFTSFSEIDNNSVQIYPNPVSLEFYIDFNNLDFFNVEIVDVAGRILLKQENINNFIAIKTSRFSDGIYFIKLINDKGTQIHRVVIKK